MLTKKEEGKGVRGKVEWGGQERKQEKPDRWMWSVQMTACHCLADGKMENWCHGLEMKMKMVWNLCISEEFCLGCAENVPTKQTFHKGFKFTLHINKKNKKQRMCAKSDNACQFHK